MIIINSGTYVIPEFQAEVGKIPPCFLPLGNKKLLEHQVEVLREEFDESIYVSLPDDYQLNIDEKMLLKDLEVEAVLVPSQFTLGQNILYVLNTVDYQDSIVRFLHGDTLIRGFQSAKSDCIGVANTEDFYTWEKAITQNCKQKGFKVWCGYFSFSSVRQLIKYIALSNNDFVEAVHLYAKEKQIHEEDVEQWYDCGHINSYFKTRGIMTTERAFNEIRMQNNVIYKTSDNSLKIEAESRWFNTLPASLKRFTPNLIDFGTLPNGNAYYSLEYLPNLPLSELYVHGRLHHHQWINIISKVTSFLEAGQDIMLDDTAKSDVQDSFKALVIDKTYQRVERFIAESNFELKKPFIVNGASIPSINHVIEDCITRTMTLKEIPAVVHGDLCFSNILYDSRINDIKVIDPRGIDYEDNFTIFGDQKYELAKLTHSVIGFYDYIIAGRFDLKKLGENNYSLDFKHSKYKNSFTEEYKKLSLNGVSINDIMPLTVLLFISMLPLHNDRKDRQAAMLVNALRLYAEYMTDEA